MLVNRGTLLAENGYQLDVFTNSLEQLGTLRTESGSQLNVFDDQVTSQGRLELAGGSMGFSGDHTLDGTSTLSLDLSQENLTALEPLLQVAGFLTLGGTLEARLEGGYQPALGDTFEIASTSASIDGNFQNLDLPDLPGEALYWSLDNDGTTLSLAVLSDILEGDFDYSGFVDVSDFLAWQRREVSDPVSADDLDLWRAYYGNSASGSATTAVPEAATALVLSLGLLVGCFVRV